MNKILTYLFIFLFGIIIVLLLGLHQEQISKDSIINMLQNSNKSESISVSKLPKIKDLNND